MNLTIAELARAVGKSETYVRQHVHRKHLTTQRDGRNVSVALDEAARWARQRGLSLDVPARASVTMGAMRGRAARVTVLVWDAPGRQTRNLFTLIRHRRRDALGPWASEPDETWSERNDLGHELRLLTFDGPFERCQAWVDRIRGSGTLPVNDREVHYALEPVPRRHWAYRDERPLSDASMRSPFARHSAEIVEYWSFAAEPRQHWLEVLDSLEGEFLAGLVRLGFPLDRRSDRIGNLMIAGAQDAITCDLELHRDRTLRFRVSADELLPGACHATIWASHSRDEVLRRDVPVVAGQTEIEVASDIDHTGFAVYRTADGQCVDLREVFLCKEITLRSEIESGPTQHIHGRQGRLVHKVRPSGPVSTVTINADDAKAELDIGIRRQWLDRQIRERVASARREGNVWRFEPQQFDEAADHFIRLLRQDADQEGPVYLADPYFMHAVENAEGARLYLDMFAATTGRDLLILCADRPNGDTRPWWSNYPTHLTRHVSVRSFRTHAEPSTPGFHDRYLVTPRRETIITHSLNGWRSNGVTFACIPYGVYRAEADRLWEMAIGSTAERLFVREISDGQQRDA